MEDEDLTTIDVETMRRTENNRIIHHPTLDPPQQQTDDRTYDIGQQQEPGYIDLHAPEDN